MKPDVSLLAAMEQGFRDAGFVCVKASARRPSGLYSTYYEVSGDCPCGLGTSRVALAVTEAQRRLSNVKDLARSFREITRRAGLKHIEIDRAEGRWR